MNFLFIVGWMVGVVMTKVVVLADFHQDQGSSSFFSTSSSPPHRPYHHHARRLVPNYPGDDGIRRNTGFVVETPTDPADHEVNGKELPYFDQSLQTKQFAGLLPADHDNSKWFFYWFFYPDMADAARNNIAEEDIPLVIWLNGGPGCSSMDGLFLEHGPLKLVVQSNPNPNNNNIMEDEWLLTTREDSWHKAPAYVVYVDQPVGTGLSFCTNRKYPSNDEEVNIDFYIWLEHFLILHANVLLTSSTTPTANDTADSGNGMRKIKRPFYFSGESHAGHYIPSMMTYINKQNEKNTKNVNSNNDNNNKILMPLSGALIGNGWVDPYHQYAAAAAAYGHGIIGRAQQNALDILEQRCQADLLKKRYVSNTCFDLLTKVVQQSHGIHSNNKVSQYDVRKVEPKYGDRTWPLGHKDVEAYLGGFPITPAMKVPLSQVLNAIHAMPSHDAGQVYQECTDPPYNALEHQDGLGVVPDVQYLLDYRNEENIHNNDKDGRIRLLFFNGIMDLICNHVGNEILLEQLPWSKQNEWISATRYAWQTTATTTNGNVNGDQTLIAGYMKEYENLSFLKLLNCGHMVPYDQPQIALEMLSTFIYKRSFGTSKQDLSRAAQGPNTCNAGGRSSTGASCPKCPSTTSTTTDQQKKGEEENQGQLNNNNNASVMKFVIAHSWLGAIFAVVIFLGFYAMMMKRRSSSSSAVGGFFYRNVPSTTSATLSSSSLEMKEQPYRDYHDDDDLNEDDDLNDEPSSISNGRLL